MKSPKEITDPVEQQRLIEKFLLDQQDATKPRGGFFKPWHGVLALIWLLFGLTVLWLIERHVDSLFRDYFSHLWVIGGCYLPTFLLAISGIRNGNTAGRICGFIALFTLAVPVMFIIYAGFGLQNH